MKYCIPRFCFLPGNHTTVLELTPADRRGRALAAPYIRSIKYRRPPGELARGADPELPAHFQRGPPTHRDRVGHLSARWTLLRRAARACLERAVALADPATTLEAVFGCAGFRVWVAVPLREAPASGVIVGAKALFSA